MTKWIRIRERGRDVEVAINVNYIASISRGEASIHIANHEGRTRTIEMKTVDQAKELMGRILNFLDDTNSRLSVLCIDTD